MTTVGLAFRKDLRLLRPAIVAWLLALSVQLLFLLGTLDRALDTDRMVRLWSSAALILTLAHVALLAALLIGAVQADPPDTPTAFWLTRPLSHRTVLGAKLLFCLVVIAIPWVAGNLAALTGRGVTPADALRNLPRLLLAQALVLLPVLVVAGLTRTFAGAVVGLVGLVTALALLSMLAVALRPPLDWDPRRAAAGELIAALVAIGMGAAALASTYQRRGRRAAAILALGVPLAIAPLHAWPWSLAGTRATSLPASIALVTTGLDSTGTVYALPEGADEWVEWSAVGHAAVTGLPEGLRARAIRSTVEVRWNDGRREAARVDPRPTEPPIEARQPVPRSVEGLGPVSCLSGEEPIWLAVFGPHAFGAHDTAQAITSSRLRVEVRLVRDRLVARLPLQRGARWAGSSQRLVVARLSVDEPGSIEVNETGYVSRTSAFDDMPSDNYRPLGPYRYVLLNPLRREIIETRPDREPAPAIPVLAFGLAAVRHRLHALWPRAARWSDVAFQETWLREAELVKLEELFVAQGERTLGVAGLRLPSRSDERSR